MSDKKKNEILIIDENSIKNKIYIIRGQKVMLDFDLAAIYGYSTSRFNEQVKRNIEKFEEDFMFQLTKEECDSILISQNATSSFNSKKGGDINLRSQIVTANQVVNCNEQSLIMTDNKNNESNSNLRSQIVTSSETESNVSKQILISQNATSSWGGIRYLPYAFTEQGIYMLMTVLRGDLAIKQSKALIRLFKLMKDYLVEKNELSSINDVISLTSKVNNHDSRLLAIENRLAVIADSLIDPNKHKEYLIKDGERFEADVAYKSIYNLAKNSITIIDDYIGIKTLDLLKGISIGVKVSIYSDNVSKDKITDIILNDFIKQTNIDISLTPTDKRFHDRYIIIDEKYIYLCGSSSKDAGEKITSIRKLDRNDLLSLVPNIF